MDPNLTPDKIAELATQAAMKLVNDREAAAKAAADAEAARKAEIETEVQRRLAESQAEAAAKAQADAAAAAKSRRLPVWEGTQAPAVTAYADTRKFDSLNTADLAFYVETMTAAKRKNPEHVGVSNSALKALAVRIAEDKNDTPTIDKTSTVAEESRRALKAAGIDPSDVLTAAKANELNYSTQAGYGDEWAAQVWSSQIWPAIRANTFVLQKLGTPMEIPQGAESMPIPIEGADPTWYRVGQATDLNATTGRPDATVGASKAGTVSRTLSAAKIGARVVYTGELEEDSIVPWVPQLRMQMERSGGEQVEHLLIDGDTATAATTNINHIGGTPTSTGLQQDLFLALDGFRKLALVTNTANSRSAGGLLADTDFLETVKLMGVGGLNGSDKTKTEFIVDANVYWKILTLATVKTQDVFPNATIVGGALERIWGYVVNPSFFMHFRSTTNPRKVNAQGKVDLTTQANNTLGAILSVRWDQWMLGYKRRARTAVSTFDDADGAQITTTIRLGMQYRDTEASAISYNVLV